MNLKLVVGVRQNERSKQKRSWKESRRKARRDVVGDGGRLGDSGSRSVDDETTRRVCSSVAAGNWSQVVIELDVLGAKNPRN